MTYFFFFAASRGGGNEKEDQLGSTTLGSRVPFPILPTMRTSLTESDAESPRKLTFACRTVIMY